MLLLLFLTGITVLIVVQNTLELLIGIKALPLSTRVRLRFPVEIDTALNSPFLQQFTLGITSLSKLGPIGAALEVCIIFYLGATSTVGLYTMPWMRNVRPRIKQTSLSLLIINCALVLILSSAQPLLSRIIGKAMDRYLNVIHDHFNWLKCYRNHQLWFARRLWSHRMVGKFHICVGLQFVFWSRNDAVLGEQIHCDGSSRIVCSVSWKLCSLHQLHVVH